MIHATVPGTPTRNGIPEGGRSRWHAKAAFTDVAVKARKDDCWHRDVPRGCGCPWTWNGAEWVRPDGATCGVRG